jgi:hypothetical protein
VALPVFQRLSVVAGASNHRDRHSLIVGRLTSSRPHLAGDAARHDELEVDIVDIQEAREIELGKGDSIIETARI